jgi:hypothetical protein
VRTVIPSLIRARPRRYGAAVVALGFVLLVALRFWASPVGRTITGRDGVSLVAFLGIPLFLGLLAAGIGLFLLEPER